MRQLALDIIQPPAPAFDNFVPGANGELLAQLVELLEQLHATSGASRERFFYLWGELGSGRTHLLRAAIAAARTPATYVACSADIRFDDATQLLAADDVERLGADAQVALFNRYNALRESGGALIAAGSVPPVQLKLRADLVTRLGWGLVYQVHSLSDAEKSQALVQHAAARGFALPGEVVSYLLTHAPRGMGALFATLDALDQHSLETKRAVTVPLVRDLLKNS